jgi:uncharacterized membrane protein YfcA
MFIILASAAGLSGAGTTIPFMLIFFHMDMKEAVPLSAFDAVISTFLRFGLNYNQMHPTMPDRNVINYEVVITTIPAVTLGSYIGVQLHHVTSELT